MIVPSSGQLDLLEIRRRPKRCYSDITGIRFTNGVDDLIEYLSCGWVIDLAGRGQFRVGNVNPQYWEFVRLPGHVGMARVSEDKGLDAFATFRRVGATLPCDRLDLYVLDGVLMTPGEYDCC